MNKIFDAIRLFQRHIDYQSPKLLFPIAEDAVLSTAYGARGTTTATLCTEVLDHTSKSSEPLIDAQACYLRYQRLSTQLKIDDAQGA